MIDNSTKFAQDELIDLHESWANIHQQNCELPPTVHQFCFSIGISTTVQSQCTKLWNTVRAIKQRKYHD